MTTLPRTVGIAGLGLMGASLARALRAADPAVRIVAVEPREDVRERALAERVADEALAAPGPALGACSLAVLCTPVASIEALMAPVSRLLPDGAILTDVGGAKERVVAEAARAVRSGVRFVGAHPMFGGHGGYAAANAERWKGGTVAVCTDGDPAAVEARRRAPRRPGREGGPLRGRGARRRGGDGLAPPVPPRVARSPRRRRRPGPLAARLAGPGLKDMTRLAVVPLRHPGRGRAAQRAPARGGRAASSVHLGPDPRRHRRLARGGPQRPRGGARRARGALLVTAATSGPLSCRRTGPLRGALSVPGDKSISHRSLLFGALATGETRVTRPPRRRGRPLHAEGGRGARARRSATRGASVVVVPPERLREPGDVIDCGNSGTSLRLLTGVLSGDPGPLGADRRRVAAPPPGPPRHRPAPADGREPLRARRRPAAAGRGPGRRAARRRRHVLEVASAQVKSAILLAGLFADGETTRRPSRSGRATTPSGCSRGMGVAGARRRAHRHASAPARPRGGRVDVPGDISSAAFFLCGAAALPGSEVTVRGTGHEPDPHRPPRRARAPWARA